MDSVWTDVLTKTRAFVKKPERFLSSEDAEDFDKSKILLKVLYDGAKLATEDPGQSTKDTLSELIIEDFDEEQVWAGVELQNNYVQQNTRERLSQLLSLPKSYFEFSQAQPSFVEDETLEEEEESEEDDFQIEPPEQGQDSESNESSMEENEEESGNEEMDDEDEKNSIFDDPDFQHMSDSDLDDKLPLFDKTDSEDEDDEEDEEAENDQKEAKERELEDKTSDYMSNAMKAMKSQGKRSEIEDKFFSLDEMESYLDAEDKKAMKDTEEDEDNDVDYFASEDEDEEEEENEVTNVMYKDFFERVEDDNNVSKDILESDEEEREDLGEIKSTHEMRTMRLQKKIKDLEKEAVNEKPWQMTGEVAALERPENALLEEHLDYETVTKQAPIITEEVSKRLEDIIKQRIKDQAWDDVERKVKPVENPYDYKKKLILDQEKSKLSLAQVYEEEYLKQKGDLEASKKAPGMLDDEEEDKPETLDDVKNKMKDLFMKLDTLTHYHYTPQAHNAEVKIVRNMPSIAMEEVAPVGMSDANLLAPQEIADKKRGEDVGSSERTETDKKRDLRMKKAKQRKMKKSREQKKKLVEQLNPGLATKYSKKAAMKAIEQAEKEGKVQTIKDKKKAVKSSKAFFDKMQNEVQSIVSDIKADKSKKGKRKGVQNIATFKL